jgi:poly(3-hydroxybutyrate) depolymerase
MTQRTIAAAIAAAFFVSGNAGAEVITKTGSFGGMGVNYRVVLPDDYDSTRAYPLVLAFAGGSQEMRIVDSALDNHWIGEAERRGYIVVSPEAPGGRLFFAEGAAAFPEFLDQILRDYRVEGGKLHIAGRSNGGLSAFHVAASYPDYFVSLTGFPGLLQPATDARLELLRSLCIYMHVGENDPSWRSAMRTQYETLRQKGFRIRFAVEAGQGHGLDSLAGDGSKRLFDQLDEARGTCAMP